MDYMYIIYRGSFTELPEDSKKVLYVGEGKDYLDGLKKINYDINKIYYTRGSMDKEGIQYFDFGSWIDFIALGTKEQLGKYLKKKEG